MKSNACFRFFSRCGTSHEHDIWLQCDCCGWVCVIFTWLLLLFACFVANTALFVPFLDGSFIGKANIGLFNAFVVLALWSHFRAMTTDPGAVPKEALPLDYYESGCQLQERHNVCKRCQHYKPPRAHHCSICQRCVVRMDHHCPWINNCVGVANHKFFVLFCFYVMCSALHANGLMMYRALHCMHHSSLNPSQRLVEPDYCKLSGSGFILLIFLCIEAILFGLFTMCMLCDQYSVVFSSQTQVERLKPELPVKPASARSKTTSEYLAEVFGGDAFSPMWLVPVQARWKSRDRVYQWMMPRADWEAALEAGATGRDAAAEPNDARAATELNLDTAVDALGRRAAKADVDV